MPYDLGDVVPLAVEVRDSTGTLANATSVVCTVTLPDGTTATPTVSNTSTGVYSAPYTPTTAGRYTVRWVATGTNAAAYADVFDVVAADATWIVSLSDVREALNLSSSNTTHDDELRLYAGAATTVIEAIIGPAVRRTVTETHVGGKPLLNLYGSPASVSSVTVNGTATTSYYLDATADQLGCGTAAAPSEWPTGQVVVTYVTSGTVPPNVVLAARELVRHLYQFGQQGSKRPGFGGTSADVDTMPVAGYAVPNRVIQLLRGSEATGLG